MKAGQRRAFQARRTEARFRLCEGVVEGAFSRLKRPKVGFTLGLRQHLVQRVVVF